MRNLYVFIVLFLVVYPTLFAQDEPVLTVNRTADRYWAILVKSPRKGTTFDRVCRQYPPDILLQKSIEQTQAEAQNAKSFLLHGLVLQKLGQYDESIQALKKSQQLHPKDPLPPFYLGEIFVTQNKLTEAAASLEESLRNQPLRVDLHSVFSLLGKTYQRLGETQKASNVWKQLEQQFPDDPDVAVFIAETLESEGQDGEALKRYENLIASTTDNAERVRFTISVTKIKIRQGKTKSALDDLNELLNRLEPGSPFAADVQNQIKTIFAQNADDDGWAEFYQQRLAKNPNDPATVQELASGWSEQGKTEEAQKLLMETLEKQPANVPLRFALIDILLAQQKYSAAAEQYQHLDRVTPNNTDVLLQWGRLTLEHLPEGKEDALKIWRRIAQSKQNDAVTQTVVADILIQHQLAEHAEEFFRNAVDLRPDDLPYRINLAKFYQRQQEPKKVIDTLRDFVQEERKTATNLTQTAKVFVSMDLPDEAAELFRQAVSLEPNDQDLRWQYAKILLKQGKTDSAVTQINTVEQQIEDDEQFEAFLQQEIKMFREERQLDFLIQKREQDITFKTEKSSATVRDYWRLAMYFQAEVQTAKAVQYIEKALREPETVTKREPETVFPIQRTAAEIYVQNSDNDKAEALYETLLRIDLERKTEYLRQLVLLQLKLGKKKQAIQTVQQLLTSTANAETLSLAAEVFLTIGKFDESIELLRRALLLQPENRQLADQLAELLAETGKEIEAAKILEQFLEKTDDLPGKKALFDTLIHYYQTAGKTDILLQKLKKKSETPEKQKESVILLAVFYQKNSDFAAARKILERQLQQDTQQGLPPDADVLRELVFVTESQNDFAAAVNFQEDLCSQPHNTVDDDKLQALYEKAGQKEKAEKFLSDRVMLNPNPQERLAAIDKMIQQEQYAAARRVLNFLEIHEKPDWRIAYRTIAVDYYGDADANDSELTKYVQQFRNETFDDLGEPNDVTKIPPSAWYLPIRLPRLSTESATTNLAVDDAVFPQPFQRLLKLQEHFLPTLFRNKLRRNSNAAQNDTAKPFLAVSSLDDARFFALCFLLKQYIGTPEFSNIVTKIRSQCSSQQELLRLEYFLLLLYDLDTGREPIADGLLRPQIDAAQCEQNILQIVTQLALNPHQNEDLDWREAGLNVFFRELWNQRLASPFQELSEEDIAAQLRTTLAQYCRQWELTLTDIKKEQLLNDAQRSIQDAQQMVQRLRQFAPSLNEKQKNEFLVDTLCSLAEQRPDDVSHYFERDYKRLLFPLLQPAQRERVTTAFHTVTKNNPLVLIRNAAALRDPTFPFETLRKYEPFSWQLQHIMIRFHLAAKHSIENQFSIEQRRQMAEAVFDELDSFLLGAVDERYDFFSKAEQWYLVNDIADWRSKLSYSNMLPTTEEFRRFLGLAPGNQSAVLTVEQQKEVAELEHGLQQLAAFAFQVPELFQTELTLQKMPPPEDRTLPQPLHQFLPELTGKRTIDRSLLQSVLDGKPYFAELTPSEALFFRLGILCRALDTKTGKTEDGNFQRLLRFLQQKNATETEQRFAAALLNRLEELNGNPQDRDAEYRRLAQQLSANKEKLSLQEQIDAAEVLTLALIEVKQKRFDAVMPLLDSIPLKIPQDLRARELIAATLGTQDETAEQSDPQRTETALNRLLNFPLSDQELFQLLPLLEKTKRNADAHNVLTQLVATTNDRQIQNELLHRLRDVPAGERDNAVKIAQRIFRNSSYFSEPRHFALDSYIFCTAAEVLKKERLLDAMSEVLKQRCRRIQDKAAGSIVLAQLYVIIGKEDEAKKLTADLAKHPSYESERRNAVTALLLHFEMKKELEVMNLLLMEAPSSRREL